MSDFAEVLKAVITPERTTAERLKSLAELHDFLRDEAAVHELCKAARVEESVDVRRAMLAAITQCDVTRLKDRAPFLDTLATFAAMDPEPDLRAHALGWIGEYSAHDPSVEALLVESLLNDLDPRVLTAALHGLKRCTRKSRPTIEKLAAAGRTLPKELRPAWLEVVGQIEKNDQQTVLVGLLHPWEPSRGDVLDRFAAFPTLAPAAVKAIVEYLRQEPSRALQAKAVGVLTGAAQTDPALFTIVLDVLSEVPDHGELLAAFKDRLASYPDLVEKLKALFGKTGSTSLKCGLFDLLGDAIGPDIAAAALKDPSPWVRYRAIDRCTALLPRHAELMLKALREAVAQEGVVELRERMMRAFMTAGKKDKATEAFLVEQAAREGDPALEHAIVAAVLDVPIDDSNRAALLRVYQRVLVEPHFDPNLRANVFHRLKAFAYRDEPELVACYRAMMERSTSIEEVDDLHEQLRKLEPDLAGLMPLLLKLFQRWAHHYARDPLHQWVKDFRDQAPHVPAAKAAIPWVVKLTGATWAMDAADASAQKANFLGAMREALSGSGGYRASQNLLEDGWKNRTLKKSDLIALFKLLLHMPGQDGLKQSVMKIMGEGKVVNAEIVDLCLDELEQKSDYEIYKFLSEHGPLDPTFKERLMARVSPAGYAEFCRVSEGAHDITEIKAGWNHWEYQGWRTMYREWKVGEVFMDQWWFDEFERILSSPAEKGYAPKTLQYWLLENLWRFSNKDWSRFCKLDPSEHAKVLRGAGRLMRAATGELRDRAIAIFKAYWRFFRERKGEPDADLRGMADEVSAELARLNQQFGGKKAREAEPLK